MYWIFPTTEATGKLETTGPCNCTAVVAGERAGGMFAGERAGGAYTTFCAEVVPTPLTTLPGNVELNSV